MGLIKTLGYSGLLAFMKSFQGHVRRRRRRYSVSLHLSLSISPPKTMLTPLLVVHWFTCEHHILQSSLWPRVLANQFILKLWAESHPSPCFGFSWFSVSNVRNGGTWECRQQEGSRVTAWGHSMISVYHWAAGSQLEPIPCLQS